MSNFPARGTLSHNRSKTMEQLSETHHFDEAFRLLEQLWNTRLVERLSRPLPNPQKLILIRDYQLTLGALHGRLNQLLSESKEKAARGYRTPGNDWGKLVRGVESRYSQVLLEGSFKHLGRVCQLLGLSYESGALETIGIARWANFCLQAQDESTCCC